MAAPKGTKRITILGALVPISRADGTSYPAFRDDVVTVPSGVAAKLVEAGVAELLGSRRSKAAETALVEPAKGPAESKTEGDATGGDGDATSDGEGDDGAGDGDATSDGDGENDSENAEGGDGDASGASSEDASDEPPPVEKPAKAAKEATWREYAISMGHDPDEAAEATRADLIALYG